MVQLRTMLSIAALQAGAGALPVPTAPQLAWQQNEIMALIHFNMATFFHNGDPGCNAANWPESQKPVSFAPAKLNVSQWIVSMKALGVKEAVLTAKHGCGFLLWPTKCKGYSYSVASSPIYQKFGDVTRRFADSCRKYGLIPGVYYLGWGNFWMNISRDGDGGYDCAKDGPNPSIRADEPLPLGGAVHELWRLC